MSQSDRLRQTATGFGGGSGTYNKKARLLEGNLYDTTATTLISELQERYPHYLFPCFIINTQPTKIATGIITSR